MNGTQAVKIQEKSDSFKYESWIFFSLIGLLAITPYALNVWWKFLPSLAAIVLLMRWKTHAYVSDLGLSVSKIQAVVAVGVFACTVALANDLVPRLLHDAGIALYQGDQWNIGWALMPITQSLLEEFVLRALLLGELLFLFRRKKLISFVAAMIFVVWHLVFFPLTQGVWLNSVTLITLFLFGYASNNFFLTYRNIAIPLALHAGWNIVKFGGEYFDSSTSQRLSEAQAFNAVEGSWKIAALAFSIAVVSEFVMLWNLRDKTAKSKLEVSNADRNQST